jgi:hypothetical protein
MLKHTTAKTFSLSKVWDQIFQQSRLGRHIFDKKKQVHFSCTAKPRLKSTKR